jgi:hypothetical protein
LNILTTDLLVIAVDDCVGLEFNIRIGGDVRPAIRNKLEQLDLK